MFQVKNGEVSKDMFKLSNNNNFAVTTIIIKLTLYPGLL